ncbi:MAG TPA: IclR family transcriptional regulator [Alphaproteobacteria bacterium]|nr:IclR family transcriptional regulator [Alphaproteobacteria bacterium]
MAKALEKTRAKSVIGEGGRSARRVLSIFELMLIRGEPVTVAELVTELAIPKSTAYELVRTLSAAGYIERSGAAAYFLGRKLFELGMAYRSHVDLLKEGGKIVEELRDETGETVQLSVLENNVMLVLVKEESSKPIRIISRVGSRVPVNWAAAGRLLVSDLTDQELKVLLHRIVKPSPTGRAPTNPDELVRQIKRFRAQGFGFELNEANEHAGCVAAPVTDVSGKCVAAISIVAPEQRLQRRHRELLIASVRRAAEKLSRRLGAA